MSSFGTLASLLLVSAECDVAEKAVKLLWKWNENTHTAGAFGSFVDVIIPPPASHHVDNGNATPTLVQVALEHHFVRVLVHILDTCPDEPIALSLFIPLNEGYVTRSDLFEERLRGSSIVRQTWSFVKPLQHHPGQPSTKPELGDLLNTAMGVAWLQTSDPFTETGFEATRAEFSNRLSLPWLSATPVTRKTIAIVGEYRSRERSGRFYGAARALGIDIVAFERPGHWLDSAISPAVAFVPFDIQLDETFVTRVTDAIRSYPSAINGILSSFSTHHELIARVAESLRLPTFPASAIATALDKFKTRQYDDSANGCALIQKVEQVDQLLTDDEFVRHGFPRIVKPCRGWDSEAVTKVTNAAELREAVQRAVTHKARSPEARQALGDHSGGDWETAVVVEPYCEGPEVDVNFVLWNGDLLFSEIVDNFPCPGDTSTVALPDGFLEEQSLLPSALPTEEVHLLRDTLHRSLLRMGFHSGVLHVEARVRNSQYAWLQGPDGHLDLRSRQDASIQATSSPARSFLIEVNPRPAGYWDTVASAFTNGVDYYAQQLLHAVNDAERFRHLAIPFVNGPQFFCTSIPILAHTGGVLAGDPSLENLQQRFPELAAHIIKYQALYRVGEVVPPPRHTRKPYLAIVMLFSRTSRSELLDVVRDFRGQVRDEIGRVLEQPDKSLRSKYN